MGQFIDLTGQKFGKATVISRAGRDKNNLLLWNCACDCGNTFITRGQDLRRGKSTNCGCRHSEVLRERNYKHGMAKSRPYRIWKAMHTRCYNPNANSYADYGGRGIKICERWLNSFENFWSDMQDGYADDLEIDRIDHDGDYEPDNCRWASDTTQNRNKRDNRKITCGTNTYTLAEFAEICGLPYDLVKSRVRRGWGAGEIIMGRRVE